MTHIQNAIIKSAKINDMGREILTAWLDLDYGGACQSFGGYCLHLPKSYAHYELKGFAGHFIWRCMEIAGVDDWSKLPGKTIRVKMDSKGFGANIVAIGHIIKDDWFSPTEDFKKEEQNV